MLKYGIPLLNFIFLTTCVKIELQIKLMNRMLMTLKNLLEHLER